jgi:hypothetical protein
MYISLVRTIYINSLSLNINTFSKSTLDSYDFYIIINSTIFEITSKETYRHEVDLIALYILS